MQGRNSGEPTMRSRTWAAVAALTVGIGLTAYAMQPPADRTEPTRPDTPLQLLTYRVQELERQLETMQREKAKPVEAVAPVVKLAAKPAKDPDGDERAYADSLESRAK